MESGYHPDDPHASDFQHLFDQMDTIVADSNAAEIAEQVAEAERLQAQYERQMDVLMMMCEFLDPEVADALCNFYDDPTGTGVRTMALDVAGILNGMLYDPKLTRFKESQVLFMAGLNNVLIDASLGQLENGRFVPTYPKADAQLNIIEDDAFDPEMKTMLLDFVDDVMPGEPFDYDDPEALQRALDERHKWADEAGLRRQRGTIIEAEFSRFGVSRDDPEYVSFIGLIKAMIGSGLDQESVESFYGDDSELLRLLGISQAEFVASIRTVYDRIRAIE